MSQSALPSRRPDTTGLSASSHPTLSPYQIFEALFKSLPLPIQRACRPHGMFPEHGNSYTVWRWQDWDQVKVAPADIHKALELVEATLSPCSPDVIRRGLAWLRAATISREATPEDWRLRLAVYAEELARYPEDAVVAAIREYGRANRYWPALADLIAECNKLVRERKSLRVALYHAPEAESYRQARNGGAC